MVLRPKLVLLLTEILQNFICSPSHHRKSTAQDLYESGPRRRVAAYTRPAKSQNTFSPVGIPQWGRLRRQEINNKQQNSRA